MATYSELYDIRNNSDFNNKLAIAVMVKAQALIDGVTPSTNQLTWAKAALVNPHSKAQELWGYVIAKNKGLDTSAILSAADTAIQTNVDAAVDALVDGGIV